MFRIETISRHRLAYTVKDNGIANLISLYTSIFFSFLYVHDKTRKFHQIFFIDIQYEFKSLADNIFLTKL